MKFCFLYIISFAFTGELSAQYDSTSIFIIEDAIRNGKDVNRIIYTDTSLTYYRPFSDKVSKNKIVGFKDTTKVVFKLSKSEIKFIDKEFKKIQRIAWNPNMFANSLMIAGDSILKIFSDAAEGKEFLEKNFAKNYFLFSQPVYFRNGSFAVFRLIELYRPVEGYDLLYFYHNIEGKWQQYMMAYLGAW